jgi:hypothetical protein
VKRPTLRIIAASFVFWKIFGNLDPRFPENSYGTRSVISILWLRLKNVVGPEYAPLNTGVNTTRGNSGNGALPIRESVGGGDEDDTE